MGGPAELLRCPNIIYWRKRKSKPSLKFVFSPRFASLYIYISLYFLSNPTDFTLVYLSYRYLPLLFAWLHILLYTDFPLVGSRTGLPSHLLHSNVADYLFFRHKGERTPGRPHASKWRDYFCILGGIPFDLIGRTNFGLAESMEPYTQTICRPVA